MNSLRFFHAFLLPAALWLNAVSAAAQTPPTPPTFSVSVTESHELVEEVGTTRRVTRADIEARNAQTLDEALRLVAGVYVRTGGDGTPRIDVRGFRSRHVLLLVNGVLVNSTSDGQFDPARISTESIREIKISYGNGSVLYGDNALAAVIEITTVDDKSDAGLHVLAGTPDQRGLGGRYARTLGNWSLAATATGYTTEAYRLPDSFAATSQEDGEQRQNSDRDRADLRGAVGYRVSPAFSIGSEWFVGTGSDGVPSSTINDSADVYAQTPRFERVDDYRAASGQVSVVVAPWERFNLRAWLFRNSQREDRARYDDATYSNMDDPVVQGTFQSRERTTVTGGSAIGRLDLARFGRVRMAFNQRRESFDSEGVIRDVSTAGGGGGGGGRGGGNRQTTFDVRSFSIDRHVDVYSAGAEWQVYPAKRLGAVVGAAVNVQQRRDGVTDTEPTWLAGVSYDATDTFRLHASATRKIRVPSIDQLYNTTSGNAALTSEHSYGVDFGGEYRVGAMSTIGVSAFSTQARDFIERLSGLPFENQDNYRFRGVEVTGETRSIPRLYLRGAYSYLDAADVTSDDIRPLQTRPRHRGSVEWRWTPCTVSSVRGAVYQTGSQLYDSRGSDSLQFHAENYLLVDVGYTHTLARRYDVRFDVTNLFDHLYDQAYGLPREGRTAVLGLRVRLD